MIGEFLTDYMMSEYVSGKKKPKSLWKKTITTMLCVVVLKLIDDMMLLIYLLKFVNF